MLRFSHNCFIVKKMELLNAALTVLFVTNLLVPPYYKSHVGVMYYFYGSRCFSFGTTTQFQNGKDEWKMHYLFFPCIHFVPLDELE